MPSRSASRRGRFGTIVGAATLVATTLSGAQGAGADGGQRGPEPSQDQQRRVHVTILTPRPGDNAGVGGLGWIVNLSLRFPGGPDGLRRAGFSAPQLTGPAGHNNIPPFPGTFSTGRDDRLPGLVVLVTTFSAGPGTNVANLFNLTGVTDRDRNTTEITDDWIVGAPNFGLNVESQIIAAVVDDLDGNGVFDDAPNQVPDSNGDGTIDAQDMKALGLASNVATVKFRINGNP